MTVETLRHSPRSAASESRRFIRFQLRVMAHRHSSEREKTLFSPHPRDLSVRNPLTNLT
jgi:hypothetical protein